MTYPWTAFPALRLLVVAAGLNHAVPAAANTTLTVNVTLPQVGDNGRSLDGRRIYIVPWENSTETGPEAAICVSTDAGETACAPEFGKEPSPCPDSYSCSLKVTLERPFTDFTVSVFDIDGVPQDIAETSTDLLARWQSALRESTGLDVADVAGRLEDSSVHMVWTWIESASFVQGAEFGTTYVADAGAEAIARTVAAERAPWYKPRFSRGRIAAPFTVMAVEECEAGLPPCVFNYVQIALTMENQE